MNTGQQKNISATDIFWLSHYGSLHILVIMSIIFYKAKDRAIVELTNQLHDSKAAGVEKSTQATQTDKMLGNLCDALEAYTSQNKFLNEELLEVNQLLQESMHREEKLLV
jgi:hypothetical protein